MASPGTIRVDLKATAAHERYVTGLAYEAGLTEGRALGMLSGAWTPDLQMFQTNATYRAAVTLVFNLMANALGRQMRWVTA